MGAELVGHQSNLKVDKSESIKELWKQTLGRHYRQLEKIIGQNSNLQLIHIRLKDGTWILKGIQDEALEDTVLWWALCSHRRPTEMAIASKMTIPNVLIMKQDTKNNQGQRKKKIDFLL